MRRAVIALAGLAVILSACTTIVAPPPRPTPKQEPTFGICNTTVCWPSPEWHPHPWPPRHHEHEHEGGHE